MAWGCPDCLVRRHLAAVRDVNLTGKRINLHPSLRRRAARGQSLLQRCNLVLEHCAARRRHRRARAAAKMDGSSWKLCKRQVGENMSGHRLQLRERAVGFAVSGLGDRYFFCGLPRKPPGHHLFN